MATPQESTTTVNGRLCTRSRARTVTSILTSEAAETSTDVTSTTTTSEVQIQSSVVDTPPSPPPIVATSEAPDIASTAAATSAVIAPTSISSDVTDPEEPASSQPAQSSQPPESAGPIESSVDTPPQASSPPSFPSNQLSNDQPQSTGVPSGGSAGIISPDQGAAGEGGLTIGNGSTTNVGGIVGGVVGGFTGIALISVLLFLCLRRRKTKESFAKWQQRLSEKNEESDSPPFLEKVKAIPASIGAFFAKLKGDKSGPAQNPYRRHSVRSSVSSVYSVRSNGRSRSISEPPSKLRQQLRGFGDRMPSLKRSRTLLAKKQDSFTGSKSPFPGIVEDPVIRNSKDVNNPFADPAPASNAGANPQAQQRALVVEGLQDQQRGPISPKPVARSSRTSRDPFASILDELEQRDGSGTPEWLRDTSHKRTQSATTALRSHPPSSFYTNSVYTTADNPFLDPTDVPPVPSQPLPPNPPRRPSNAGGYNAMPGSYNPNASGTNPRESNNSLFFGEPGPSRPTTMLSNNFAVFPRGGRQSDPFDLDRPEVLGFGNVNGRKEVRASVTRANSKSNRRSSVPNWGILDDGPYERASAVPGPLRNPSVKR
ncbi:hypothetical protein K469DRAFT_5354 [Zopfia rhizophila CBS 207.26]|uniref:Uncharacterized protein n=1 Tax=Zopfia rhizophila CBS 207.26 TaxID=1314779 RepID=A0A6A6EWP5_9PEZI|nr:hypothetical protein K469DRAFT_5354 [Zopfia rhizophila CBS 207.26]